MTAAARRGLVIALDGPASSGKSSVGAAAARDLGYRFVDTGLLYRAVTYLALRRGLHLSDPAALVPLVDEVELAADEVGRLRHVLVDGVDVTEEVHRAEVDRSVSVVSQVPEVRASLLARQRVLAEPGRIVMAGRDIGTVVLAQADLKIFLEATADERSRRRALERGIDPDGPEAMAILEDLRQRDDLDRNRPVAPLRAAQDAVIVGTDRNTFEQTVAAVEAVIRRAEAEAEAEARNRTDAAEATIGSGESPTDRPDWFIRATDLVGRLIYPLFTRLEFEGLHHLHALDGPVLLVSNHISNADPPLIGSYLTPALGRRIHWLGKQEAIDWPIVGPILGRNAVIGVRRGEADVNAFRAAQRVLDEGHVLCVFPEGTRSPTGALLAAKEGTAILASRTGTRIVPIGIAGTRRIWPRGQRLPLPHPRNRVVLRVGEPFTLDPIEATGARREMLQASTRRIMGRIAELLPVPQRGAYADVVAGAARGSDEDPVT